MCLSSSAHGSNHSALLDCGSVKCFLVSWIPRDGDPFEGREGSPCTLKSHSQPRAWSVHAVWCQDKQVGPRERAQSAEGDGPWWKTNIKDGVSPSAGRMLWKSKTAQMVRIREGNGLAQQRAQLLSEGTKA